MRFKIAPNSIFAILLRSPWWVSLALALGFVLAARALLPMAYWVFGAMGAVPFAVISAAVLWRQLSLPSAARIEAAAQALGRMGWREFAAAMEQAFVAKGYAFQRLERGAADWLITNEGRTTAVAAKRWKASTQGEQAVQDLQSAMQVHGASAGMLFTLGTLSSQAQRLVEAGPIEVLGAAQLARWLGGQTLKP